MDLLVKLVLPTRLVVDKKAHFVVVPGKEGELGILPLHTPILASLKEGKVKILPIDKKEEEIYFIKGGILEVSENRVNIIAYE
jgi:F-type H+-transporting ATPase subunit epsilon